MESVDNPTGVNHMKRMVLSLASLLHKLYLPLFNLKGMLLHSAVSSPWDCSKPFTLHPLTDHSIGNRKSTRQFNKMSS